MKSLLRLSSWLLFLCSQTPAAQAQNNPALHQKIVLIEGESKEVLLQLPGGLRLSRRNIIDIQNLAGESYLITGLKKGVVVIRDAEEDAYGPSPRVVIEVIKKNRLKKTHRNSPRKFYRLQFWVQENTTDKMAEINLSGLGKNLRRPKAGVGRMHAYARLESALPSHGNHSRFKEQIEIIIQAGAPFEARDGGEQQTHHKNIDQYHYAAWKNVGLFIKGRVDSSHKGKPVLALDASYKASESSRSLSSKKIKSRIPLSFEKNTKIGNLGMHSNRKEYGRITGIRKIPILSPLITRWGKSEKKSSFTLWARIQKLD